MTLNFLVRGKKNPSKINLRFSTGQFSTIIAIPLVVNPRHFNKGLQKVEKNLAGEEINATLKNLHCFLVDRYNEAVIRGIHTDTKWLKGNTGKFFKNVSF